MFSLILDNIFKRVDPSFAKLGQWSKKWQVDSMSKPQLYVGLSKLKKLCLSFCSRNGLTQVCVIFQSHTMKAFVCRVCRRPDELENTFPKKMPRLKELRIDQPKLFHLIPEDGKKSVFKEAINQTKNT